MNYRTRMTGFVAVAAVVVAGMAGMAADRSQAAPLQKHPQLRLGVLKIEGTGATASSGSPSTHVAATTSSESTRPTVRSPTASRRRSTAATEATTSPEALEPSCCSAADAATFVTRLGKNRRGGTVR